MLTSIVDACEERAVGICDVTGAHLNAGIDEFLLINFEGEKVYIMCGISNEHKQHVTKEKNKTLLRMVLDEALYGCVQSALLWYKVLAGALIDWNFALKPHGSCVTNVEIEVSQCTIVWHVDDDKMSNNNDNVVKKMCKS